MPVSAKFPALLAALAASIAVEAHADRTTVCTITVNSADEREVFRQNLPDDRYQFVELVERGRPDWLDSACRQGVKCDVLLVSGHFAGVEFYTSKFDRTESLPIEAMERAICSESCPGLFSELKEVYLFGCDTLKGEPVRSAAPEIVRSLMASGQSRGEAERQARALSERHGESSRGLMRRLFANVPAIYGFSSLAPLGPKAGSLLRAYFQNGVTDEFGSGRPSARLLGLFAPSSMVLASGMRESEPNADYRREVCNFFDERLSLGEKLGFVHGAMGRDAAEARMWFDRTEKFLASLTEAQRRDASLARAFEHMAGDKTTRERFLALARDTHDPAIRLRMVTLARNVGWLTQAQQRAELVGMIRDVLAESSMGFGEVDLICALNKDGELGDELRWFKVSQIPVKRTAQAAGLACLGSPEAHARVLKALASPDEQDVLVAQAYLRHRPITDANELRAVAQDIRRMPPTAAQVRALDTLGRHHISDREVLDELMRLFTQARTVNVQRAIAEIFLRSNTRAIAAPELLALLRQHRLKASGGEDLIDVLIRQLQ